MEKIKEFLETETGKLVKKIAIGVAVAAAAFITWKKFGKSKRY